MDLPSAHHASSPTRIGWLASFVLMMLAGTAGLFASFGVLLACGGDAARRQHGGTCGSLGRAGESGTLGWALILIPPVVTLLITRVLMQRVAAVVLGVTAVAYLVVWAMLIHRTGA